MIRGPVVAYFRVSTDRQGRSGLGLEAQREAVRAYLAGGSGRIVAEHQEVESGRNSNRPALDAALADARIHRAPLLVAKVDRLTRSVAFLSKLTESGVDVRFCDLPQIEGPTGRFMLNQMAAVAELEAGLISARTKAALAAAKARGQKLGTPGNLRNVEAGRIAAQKSRSRQAAERSRDLQPIIADLRRQGAETLQAMANGLNSRGIPTARGGAWSPTQVARLIERVPLVAIGSSMPHQGD